jgi:hypothetical protein
MTQLPSSFDSLLVTIVLVTVAIGLPIVTVLAIRFLWNRDLHLGRSKELEKLIWQLHRIASAMEHQMHLSFPAVQPGTEDASDLAYLQQPAVQAKAAAQAAAAAQSVVTPAAGAVAAKQSAGQQPAASAQAAEEPGLPPLETRDPSVEAPRAGVNSMFGL